MKGYRSIGFCILLAFLLIACGGGQDGETLASEEVGSDLPEDSGQEIEGGEQGSSEDRTTDPVQVRVGSDVPPDSLNPGAALSLSSYIIFTLVYDSLYQLSLDGTYAPALVDMVQVSEEGTVWTFTLHDGVTFHDGEPLTADDVAYSYNLYKEREDYPYLHSKTEKFESVEAIDEKTVVITLSEAVPDLRGSLVILFILPEHIWSQVENPGEFENSEMIGSGPFMLSDYRQNEFVVLEAVKDHFLDSPKIDGAIFQYFDNPDVLVQALKTGQVDMLRTLPLTAVASLREEENIEVVSGTPLTPAVRELHINVISEEDCPPEIGVCSGHPALTDPAVRLALAHAVDKQQIIDVVQLGLAKPGVTLIPEGLGHFFNDQIDDHTFDLVLANQILDEAGYLDTDGDGIREMPGAGQSLVFRLNWMAQDVDATRIADLLAPNWSQIGIKPELAGLDFGVLSVRNFPEYDFDLMIGAWGSEPDPDLLLSTMASESIPFGLNQSGYSNPEYDDLYVQQERALDRDVRVAIVHEMQEIVHAELPYIAFYYPDWVQAYRTDRFEGWPTNTDRLSLENRASLSVIEPVK